MSIAAFHHAKALYRVFDDNAMPEKVDDVYVRVWRGSIVDTYKSIGASQHFYTPVMSTLKDLGCVTVLSAGRRARPSVLALHHPPDETEYLFYSENRLTNSPESAKLRGRLELLEKRIGGINIVDTLVELEKRVARLEHQAQKNSVDDQTQQKGNIDHGN